MRTADELGLDTLVEAHDADELDRAVALGAPVIGINARDLVDVSDRPRARSSRSWRGPRATAIVVAESGVHSRAQGAAAELAGADAILVGSALMQAPDPAAKLRELLSRPLVKVCGLTREEDVAAAVEAGADLAGFVLVPESPRAARRGAAGSRHGALGRRLGRRGRRERRRSRSRCTPREDGKVRGRDAVRAPRRRAGREPLDLPWEEDDPGHWARAAAAGAAILLAGRLGADNVARRDRRASTRGPSTRARRLEAAPGVKDHAKVRAYVEAARG